MADLKNRRPPPPAKDGWDGIGRLAAVTANYPLQQQQQVWEEGRRALVSQGFEGIPETYNPAYRDYGAPVPVMARAETGQFSADERKRHNGVMEGFTAANVGQGATRVGLAVDAARNKGATAAPARVTTEAQYRALRPGTPYIAPDGTHRTKK